MSVQECGIRIGKRTVNGDRGAIPVGHVECWLCIKKIKNVKMKNGFVLQSFTVVPAVFEQIAVSTRLRCDWKYYYCRVLVGICSYVFTSGCLKI